MERLKSKYDHDVDHLHSRSEIPEESDVRSDASIGESIDEVSKKKKPKEKKRKKKSVSSGSDDDDDDGSSNTDTDSESSAVDEAAKEEAINNLEDWLCSTDPSM